MRTVPIFVLVLIIAACGGGAPSPNGDVAAEPAGWRQLPDSPLSARTRAHAFWTGSTVLVIGGTDDDRCPPNADCVPSEEPPLADGAAYDPEADMWTALPDAPVPLGELSGAVLDGTLYVWVYGSEQAPGVRPAFLSLTLGDEVWRELTAPAVGQNAFLHLVAADDQIIAYHGSQELGVQPDLAYDPTEDEWTDLPVDPLAPTFDRSVVWTDAGLVVIGIGVVPQPDSAEPAVYGAARLDDERGEWDRLPDSEIVGWNPSWSWTADRLVNASIGRSDGGETNNWGRFYPHGGTLDPVTGTWGRLPAPPAEQGAYTGIDAAGEEWIVSSDGWALHVPSGIWVELAAPDGAPFQPAATWAGDRLFVWGGMTAAGELLHAGWAWVPGAES